jgi:hypothetical protein
MVNLQEVMDTLYKAQAGQVSAFADALFEAADMKTQCLDGSQMDKLFSFGMVLMHCDKCREPHWFVAFTEHGTPLSAAVRRGVALELKPSSNFEEALQTYRDLNNKDVRH